MSHQPFNPQSTPSYPPPPSVSDVDANSIELPAYTSASSNQDPSTPSPPPPPYSPTSTQPAFPSHRRGIEIKQPPSGPIPVSDAQVGAAAAVEIEEGHPQHPPQSEQQDEQSASTFAKFRQKIRRGVMTLHIGSIAGRITERVRGSQSGRHQSENPRRHRIGDTILFIALLFCTGNVVGLVVYLIVLNVRGGEFK